MIMNVIEKDSENSKRFLEDMKSEGFQIEKSGSSLKYRYQLYNFMIIYLFKNKIDGIKLHSSAAFKSIETRLSIFEQLFLHLRDEFLNQQNSSKLLDTLKQTFEDIGRYYLNVLEQIPSCFRKTCLIEVDFVVLLQYMVCENSDLAALATKMVGKFVERFSYSYFSSPLLATFSHIIDGLYRNINSKFSTLSTSVKVPYRVQNLIYVSIKVH